MSKFAPQEFETSSQHIRRFCSRTAGNHMLAVSWQRHLGFENLIISFCGTVFFVYHQFRLRCSDIPLTSTRSVRLLRSMLLLQDSFYPPPLDLSLNSPHADRTPIVLCVRLWSVGLCAEGEPNVWHVRRGVFFFPLQMDGGHGGGSGRYTKFREAAFNYAFVLAQLGIRE